jgi:hypothetical protein
MNGFSSSSILPPGGQKEYKMPTGRAAVKYENLLTVERREEVRRRWMKELLF